MHYHLGSNEIQGRSGTLASWKATATLLPECAVKFLAAVFFILRGVVEADVEEITTSKSRHYYGLSKGIRPPSKTAH